MRIAILGPGAIGSLFAGLWDRAGQEVLLVARYGQRFEQVAENGIHLTGLGGDHSFTPRIAVDTSTYHPVDLLVITIKSYDTERALAQHASLVDANTLILTLQNGIGNLEKLTAKWPATNCLAGALTAGAFIDKEGAVHYAGKGEITLGLTQNGPSPAVTEAVAAELSKTGLAVNIHPDLNVVLYGKLAINCAINAITAILDITNGEILRLGSLLELAEAAAFETISVANAAGITLSTTDILAQIRKVLTQTADNRSSMVKDLHFGGKTEIGAINEAVVRLGIKYNIPTPINGTLTQLVSALESIHAKI